MLRQKGFSSLLILILIIVVASGYFAFKQYSYQKQLQRAGGAEGFVDAEDQLRGQIKKDEAAKSTAPSNHRQKICKNEVSGMSVKILDGWTCEVESPLNGDYGYGLSVSFDSVYVVISGVGRGGPCDGEPCTKVRFHENEVVKLNLYKLEQENIEIYGDFKKKSTEADSGNFYISITWRNMESKDLTASEKSQVLEIVDSIQIAN